MGEGFSEEVTHELSPEGWTGGNQVTHWGKVSQLESAEWEPQGNQRDGNENPGWAGTGWSEVKPRAPGERSFHSPSGRKIHGSLFRFPSDKKKLSISLITEGIYAFLLKIQRIANL